MHYFRSVAALRWNKFSQFLILIKGFFRFKLLIVSIDGFGFCKQAVVGYLLGNQLFYVLTFRCFETVDDMSRCQVFWKALEVNGRSVFPFQPSGLMDRTKVCVL